MLGRGDRAYSYYQQINPANKNELVDLFECEPYVYPQNILGEEHPKFGMARNAWLTGTASWAYQAGLKYILGIRPEYDGLCVDPCIPADWKAFSVFRRFRGAAYHIHIENPNGVQKGVTSIHVDGAAFDGALLPIFVDEKTHHVQVEMG